MHMSDISEASGDTIKTDFRASFLDPACIIESIQKAYLPLALRMKGAIQALVAPALSPPDFWEKAMKSEKTLQDYVPRLLESLATESKLTKFADIKFAMNHIVNATATFRNNIKGVLDTQHITFDTLTEELEGIFVTIMNDLKKIPPPNKAPGHAEREEMVDMVLDDTSRALIKLATHYRIEGEVVETYILALKPQVQALTVAVGDINEQHPQLLPTLAFSVAALLIPESWILRPFLSLFGFGPAGPVKGSAAAWLQSYFWGAAVEAGSWFSCLQAAGMGTIPKWAGLATKAPLLVGGLWAMLLSFFNRG